MADGKNDSDDMRRLFLRPVDPDEVFVPKKKWEIQAQTDSRIVTAHKIAQEASSKNCWIYDPESREWYTPEEFIKKYHNAFKNNPAFFRVQIRNPFEGIAAGYKQITNLQDRVMEFTKKVIDYYKYRKY